MKTIHVHFIWAIVSLTAAGVAAMAARRAGTEPAARTPAAPESSSTVALRTRVVELEAELARRDQALPRSGETPPAEAVSKGEAPAAKGALSAEQIRTLFKSQNPDDLKRAFKELDALTDRSQKLAILRDLVASGKGSAALSMLRKMGGPEAVALIAEILQKDGSAGARTQAALALGDLGDAQAIPALQEAWRSAPELRVRAAAASGLARFGLTEPAQESLRTLSGMLENADGGVREDAVDLLTKIPLPDSLPLLVKALGDPSNSHLREDAADAMAARRMTEALPFLERALQDPAENVREAAERAITRIKNGKK